MLQAYVQRFFRFLNGSVYIINPEVHHIKEGRCQQTNSHKDSTVVFVGSRQGGKTSIIYRFVECAENPKPTLALEYLFGRRSRGLDSAKEVCHMWELGGGTLFTQLLEIPITVETLNTLSIVLVLDLSLPEEMWFTMETLLHAVRSEINQVLNSSAAKIVGLKETLMELAWKRIGEDHMDKDMIDPFPVPLLILGTKYDIFQDLDPEKKKVICRCLRYVAHTNGAALQFVSTKVENLITKARVVISHMVFGTPASKTVSMDYNKPIMILFGGDSLQHIGNMPLSDDDPGKSYSRSLDLWKHTFTTHFPQVVSKTTLPDDPAKDTNFKERDVDMIRTQKDKELEQYRRDLDHKRQDWEALNFM
ncbi:cytoplasmic dynein 2 light intermediate chain 1 isoform X2 [Tachypleus tridentatus]|uniref:cytoplasmic dynein 2 light intermediate chain 1 isoform X2 n=1 Tax=Tachypleus tridentatus TaxID=6853 RepID=UPI003FD16EED